MNQLFFISYHQETTMWTLEQTGIMRESTPRNFSYTDCDETVSQSSVT